MKVTGHHLKFAIEIWRKRGNDSADAFKDSLWQFFDADRTLPGHIMKKFAEADEAHARLQELQQTFNATTTLPLVGKTISLALAVRLIGSAGRIQSMWNAALHDKWYHGEQEFLPRDPNRVYAKKQVSNEDAQRQEEAAMRSAQILRSGISLANAKEIEVTDPKLIAFLGVVGEITST